nr:Na(+)/H(+) antiporter subunit B [Bowmanella dokdonensis]
MAKFLIPFILIFAFYVQFHGDFSPGGGFQAGVIISAAAVLYVLAFGLELAERGIPLRALQYLSSTGILLYTGVGVACLLKGGNFLDYSVLLDNDVAGQHLGIILIELGVGITVASTLTLIFFTFAHWSRHS